MERPAPISTAAALVAERFPFATAAWLGGSAAAGVLTEASDLDVTVLLPDGTPGAPYRESLERDGWPVELFVHTSASVRHYVGRDLVARKPTMARLVAASVPLLAGQDPALVHECAAVIAAGPPPLTVADRDARRYLLTDLVDDLRGGGSPPVVGAVAVATWWAAIELLLAVEGRWGGVGKWLAHELETYDAALATRFHSALVAGVAGDVDPLVRLAGEVLDRAGGPLWMGYRAAGVVE
jgi:hypothetical protein